VAPAIPAENSFACCSFIRRLSSLNRFRQRAGQFVHSSHPNLRKLCTLRFCHPNDLTTCDVLFLCLPHGTSAAAIAHYRSLAPRVIDLSADFRLRDAALYQRWYGATHPAPDLLPEAVYGLPELHRAELPEATLVSGTGCMATTAILGWLPFIELALSIALFLSSSRRKLAHRPLVLLQARAAIILIAAGRSLF